MVAAAMTKDEEARQRYEILQQRAKIKPERSYAQETRFYGDPSKTCRMQSERKKKPQGK